MQQPQELLLCFCTIHYCTETKFYFPFLIFDNVAQKSCGNLYKCKIFYGDTIFLKTNFLNIYLHVQLKLLLFIHKQIAIQYKSNKAHIHKKKHYDDTIIKQRWDIENVCAQIYQHLSTEYIVSHKNENKNHQLHYHFGCTIHQDTKR